MIKIGVDIVDIERIKGIIEEYGDRFLKKNFTCNEISYCGSKVFPYQHFAGRFAAKEAVKKALLSANPTLVVVLKDIEIKNGFNGVPYVELKRALGEVCKNYVVEVSISHEREGYAIAMAVVLT